MKSLPPIAALYLAYKRLLQVSFAWLLLHNRNPFAYCN
jgi:hypothetical protein